jgi:hypothetical protein
MQMCMVLYANVHGTQLYAVCCFVLPQQQPSLVLITLQPLISLANSIFVY